MDASTSAAPRSGSADCEGDDEDAVRRCLVMVAQAQDADAGGASETKLAGLVLLLHLMRKREQRKAGAVIEEDAVGDLARRAFAALDETFMCRLAAGPTTIGVAAAVMAALARATEEVGADPKLWRVARVALRTIARCSANPTAAVSETAAMDVLEASRRSVASCRVLPEEKPECPDHIALAAAIVAPSPTPQTAGDASPPWPRAVVRAANALLMSGLRRTSAARRAIALGNLPPDLLTRVATVLAAVAASPTGSAHANTSGAPRSAPASSPPSASDAFPLEALRTLALWLDPAALSPRLGCHVAAEFAQGAPCAPPQPPPWLGSIRRALAVVSAFSFLLPPSPSSSSPFPAALHKATLPLPLPQLTPLSLRPPPPLLICAWRLLTSASARCRIASQR